MFRKATSEHYRFRALPAQLYDCQVWRRCKVWLVEMCFGHLASVAYKHIL